VQTGKLANWQTGKQQLWQITAPLAHPPYLYYSSITIAKKNDYDDGCEPSEV